MPISFGLVQVYLSFFVCERRESTLLHKLYSLDEILDILMCTVLKSLFVFSDEDPKSPNCTPGEYKKDCNQCRCSKDGFEACTRVTCTNNATRSLEPNHVIHGRNTLSTPNTFNSPSVLNTANIHEPPNTVNGPKIINSP